MDKIEKCLQGLCQSVGVSIHLNHFYWMTNTNPSNGDGNEFEFSSNEVPQKKSDFFIEIQIQKPDETCPTSKILPPNDLMLMIRKGKRQHDLKSLHTDPLKLLLARAWTTTS